MLIDTGDPGNPEYIRLLKKVIEEENVHIKDIIVTHWHHDHIGGVKDILNSITKDVQLWKFPRSDVQENYEDLNFQEIKNNQEFFVEGAVLRCIHTPGHTTDHVILQFQDDQSIFSGDCILGEGTAVFEDLFEYMKSLQLILGLNPPVIYPGHGNIIKDSPVEKIKYYIDHRNEREKQILEVLQNAPYERFNALDIVKKVYTDIPFYMRAAARVNVNHHLEKLAKEKLVRKIDEEGVDVADYHYQLASDATKS